MKYCISKDKKHRHTFCSGEIRRLVYKVSMRNSECTEADQLHYIDRLNSFNRSSSAVRIRNRCVLTGRARGVLRRYKMSRLQLRALSSNGLVPGVKKASW